MDDVVRSIEESLTGLNVDCAIAAVSGGVDSTTAALAAYRALGDKVKPVFIDTGYMRLGEADRVKGLLRNLLPIEVVDMSGEFHRATMGIWDAEEKRLAFRGAFYRALRSIADRYGCSWLVQGTIASDVIETHGGIKTQHNVVTDEYTGLKLIEPLRDLYKDQVRELARLLGVPREIYERQPFPGPGLLVRCVGPCHREKLDVLREATDVVERLLKGSQYFAAVWGDARRLEEDLTLEARKTHPSVKVYTFLSRATGVKGDKRSYGPIALIEGVDDVETAMEIQSVVTRARPDVTHVVMHLGEGRGRYYVAVRAVVTDDYMTADIVRLAPGEFSSIYKALEQLGSGIGYDVTPKPPATIEYE